MKSCTSVGAAVPLLTKILRPVQPAERTPSSNTRSPEYMPREYKQILEIVAEKPGATVEEITDLAQYRDITDTDIPDLLSKAVDNDDFLEFDDRYWVMRTGKYRFHRYDHPET
nr:hypothetical protein [Salinadaptatus halalkaliphilus]